MKNGMRKKSNTKTFSSFHDSRTVLKKTFIGISVLIEFHSTTFQSVRTGKRFVNVIWVSFLEKAMLKILKN